MQNIINDFYKPRWYQKCWRQQVIRLWRTILCGLLLINLVISLQSADAEDYPLATPDLSSHYAVPGLYDGGSMGTMNWHHFSNDEAPVNYFINDVKCISIIQSFALILRESVTQLATKNFTSLTNSKSGVQIISGIARAVLSPKQKNTWYVGPKYLSRENLLNRHQNTVHNFDKNAAQSFFASTSRTSMLHDNFDSCQSCQMREKAKLRSLESIKNHIIMRLGLPKLPNITKPIPVPHNIIDKFYKNLNGMLAGNRRNAAMYDVGSAAEIKKNKADKVSFTHMNAPTKSEKNVPFLRRDSKHTVDAMSNERYFQFGHQLHYQYPLNKPKYETFSNSPNQPSQDPRVIKAKGKDSWSDVQYDQHDDVQNDESEQYSRNQNFLSRNKQKDLANHDKRQMFNTSIEESGIITSAFKDGSYSISYELIRDIEDDHYTHVNSIYIFATSSEFRHNHRWEIINFKFDHSNLTIVRTIIHLYIRGHVWMREHYPDISENKGTDGKSRRPRDLIIMIHHVIRRPNNENLTHTMELFESRHRIPSGLGKWVQFEVKHTSPNWMNQNTATMTFAIKTQESWMRPFLVIDTEDGLNKQFPIHIEAFIKQPRRSKRSTSLDCQESDHEVRCCRYPLKVNFTNFGWNFVVAPTSFDAYFCNGECKVGYLEQYTHTHIASLTTSATPCCSPTKMSPLSLLYFDQDHNLVLSTIPNMSVEKCSCA